MRLRRFLLALVCTPLGAALGFAATPSEPPAQEGAPVSTEADFAALSVRPYGAQNLDLATGVTTLPDGGEVRYGELDVTLSGSWLRFLEGDFIEVEGGTVTGAFGTLRAPELRFEVASQTLRAAGGVRFEGEVVLAAEAVTLNLEDDVALLEGGVTSTAPNLEGERALVDLTGGQALLVGPYRYQEGPVTLRGAAGERLALLWDEAGAVSADTAVPPALLERFEAYGP